MQKFRLNGIRAFIVSVVMILGLAVPAIAQPKVAHADIYSGYLCDGGAGSTTVYPTPPGTYMAWRMDCYSLDWGFWFVRECWYSDQGEPGLLTYYCRDL